MNSAIGLTYGTIFAVLIFYILASTGIVNAMNGIVIFCTTCGSGVIAYKSVSAKKKVLTRIISTILGASAGLLIGFAAVSYTSSIRQENCQASKGITMLCE